MKEIVVIASCMLLVLVSAVLGRRYAEEFVEPLKGLGVVMSIAGVMAAITSLISTHTWTMSITISLTDKLEQLILNNVRTPVTFALNWF